jgi:hypothetical protein
VTRVDPLALAVFLLAAFSLAGAAQTAWFTSSVSRSFAIPLDGGLCFRSRRIFGANKTVRGFIVMVPAAGAAFALLASLAADATHAWLWPVSRSSYALIGAFAGLGFMAGELPNSFLKRQLGIEPGAAPRNGFATVLHFALDRLDSGLGMLTALSVAVEVPWLTWVYVLTAGSLIHWSFSVLMFRLGLKQRAA